MFPQLISNFSKGFFWRIHKEKFDENLFENLIAWKLATRLEDSNWYFVEEYVARVMMTVLASLIAEEEKAITSTDEEKYILSKGFFDPTMREAEGIRISILDEVMPYPKTFTLDDLINFKAKFGNELVDFRRIIETKVIELRGVDNDKLRTEKLQADIKEITDRREELIVRLKENKLTNIVLGTVKRAFIDATISLVTGDITSPTARVLNGINEVRRQYFDNPIRDEDLAYIALLKHKFT